MVYKNETITISDSATSFTAANLGLAKTLYGRAIKQITFTLATAQIRVWEDGTDPTSSVGHVIEIGDVVVVNGNDASKFRGIRTGGTSGVISVAYEI